MNNKTLLKVIDIIINDIDDQSQTLRNQRAWQLLLLSKREIANQVSILRNNGIKSNNIYLAAAISTIDQGDSPSEIKYMLKNVKHLMNLGA